MDTQAYIQALLAENKALKAQVSQLKFELEQLKRLIYGRTSERFVPDSSSNEQLDLFTPDDSEEPSAEEVEEEPVRETVIRNGRKHTAKRHPGRMPIPEHLPVETIIIEPEGDLTGLVRIGEQITEYVEYTPASLVKKVIIRPKYALPEQEDTTKVLIAKLPSRPIAKSIAGAALLAYIVVCKYVDHLPFYRQIQGFKRDYNWNVHKSTVNSWFVAVCFLLEPLYDLLHKQALQTDYLQADESKIKVLTNVPADDQGDKKAKKKKKPPKNEKTDNDEIDKKQRLGWMWVVHNPLNGYVVFNYQNNRAMEAANNTLAGFRAGYLQTDGYRSYNDVASLPGVFRLACMSHVRRKFFEAMNSDRKRAEQALGFIGRIYELDRKAAQIDDIQAKLQYRLEYLAPIYHKFKDWADEQAPNVTPQSPMGKALTYMQNQWPSLKNFFLDGRLLLDNNLIENKIRPLALGRKNYLFAGSDEAAQRAAMMYSFFATCKNHDINPMEWLTNTLNVIADTKVSQLHTLLPGYKAEHQ